MEKKKAQIYLGMNFKDAFNQKILTAEALGFKVIVLWDDNENNSKIISDVIFPKQNMPQQ